MHHAFPCPLFMGLYPQHHGVSGRDFEDFYIKGNYHLLPRVLKDAGYRTIGISSNKFICHNFGFSEGFDTFIDIDNPYLIKDELLIPFSVRGLKKIKYIMKALKEKGNCEPCTGKHGGGAERGGRVQDKEEVMKRLRAMGYF